jgi:hypothetical protein
MKDDDDSLAAFITLRALTRNVIEYLRLKQIQKSKVDNASVDEPDDKGRDPEDRPNERPRGNFTVVK